MVVSGFLPQNFGRWQGPTNGHSMNAGSVVIHYEVVGTPKSYLMRENLFKLFWALAPEPPGGISTI